jgi:hypothetical protein
MHLPEREGRGRLIHGFEEWKSRSGTQLDEHRRKNLDAPVSRRDGDVRGDVRTAGRKGYNYACGV